MTEPFAAALQSLARYNRLANARLYDGVARLPDRERKADRKAFFGSIHNTLNHILLGDRIWMGRFEGNPITFPGLDTVLYDGFADLRAARRQEDARIEAFFAGVDAGWLASDLHWTSLAGKSFRQPMAMLSLHLFNHQTHHRGQAHDLLCQAGVTDVVLDIPFVLNSAP